MASISASPNGTRRILFVDEHGSRKALYLGKTPVKAVQTILVHVEHIVNAKLTGGTTPRETASWLASIGDALREKLSRVGLVELPKQSTLGDFLKGCVLNRPDVKPATLEVWQQPCRNLCEFFGPSKDLRDITQGDAERFSQWLKTQPLSPATIAKRLSFARTFFHTAKKHKLITENPFSEVKIPTVDVTVRQYYISRQATASMLEVASPNWRTIIALCRFGGLRCPSETLPLEWKHVNFATGELTVVSPKTERYAGKGSRVVPITPDLRKHLLAACGDPERDANYVVSGNYREKANGPTGWKGCNLVKPMTNILKKAGLKRWPKLFHNLRSSCETDLIDNGHPPQAVAKWLGHDVKIAMKHYAQVTDEHFRKAIGNAESDARTTLNPAQQIPATNGKEKTEETQSLDVVGFTAEPCRDVPYTAQVFSGEGGIRTLVTVSGKLVFETNAFNRSATSPGG